MAKDNIKLGIEVDGIKEVNEAVKAVDTLKDSSKEAQNSLNELGEQSGVFTEIKSKVQGAIQGVKAFASSFKTVKGAIAATGIGALLIAVTSLVAYFKNTEAGARTLAVATTALGIIMDKVTQTFAKLGTAIVDVFTNPKEYIEDFRELLKENITNRVQGLIELFPKLGEAISLTFSGKFKEAGKVAADAVLKIGLGVEDATDKAVNLGVKASEAFVELKNEVFEAVEQAAKLVDGLESLRKSINSIKVENAELNQVLELQKQIGEDTTKDYETRRAALIEAGKAQVKIAENTAKQTGLELSLLNMQIASTSNIEERRALEEQLGDARASQIEAQTAYEIELQDVKKITREIDLEEIDRINDLTNLILESTAIVTDNKYNESLKALAISENEAIQEATKLRASEEELATIREGFDNQRLEVRKSFLEEIEQLEVSAAKNTFQKLAEESNTYLAEETEKLDNAFEAKLITQDEYSAILVKLQEDNNARINKIEEDKEKNSIEILEKYSVSKVDIIKNEFDLLRNELDLYYVGKEEALRKELDNELITQQQFNETLLGLEREKNGKLSEIQEQQDRDTIRRRLELADSIIGVAKGIADAVQAVSDDEVAAIERESDVKLSKVESDSASEQSILDKKLTDGIISQELYDEQKIALEVKLNKRKVILENEAITAGNEARKKAFIANKAMSIAQTAMDTFRGATAAFSSLAAIPVVGVPLGIAAAAAATVAGLANIKTIAQTKFEPTALGTVPSASPVAPAASLDTSSTNSPSSAPVPPSISLYGQANESSVTQTENMAGTNQQSFIRAYVVESEVTDVQERILQYQQRSEIG